MELFVIVGSIVLVLILKKQTKQYVSQNPSLEEGYDKFFKVFLICGNIPFVIMGLGRLTGMVQNSFEIFNPRSMNPFVLAAHGSIVCIWILCIYWIYFKNGAQFIEDHPGLLGKSLKSGSSDLTAKQVKVFFPFALMGGVFAMISMWRSDCPFF